MPLMGNKHNCSMVRNTHTPVDGAKACADDVGEGVSVAPVVSTVTARSVRIVSVVALCKLNGVVYTWCG